MFHSSRRIKFIRIFCIDERGNNHSCSLVNREERGGDTSIVVGTRGRRWKANVVANLFVEARRERRHPLQISSSDVYAIRSCRPTLFCRRRNRAQEPLIFVFITSRCDVISWGKEDGITSSPYPTDTAAVIPLFEWSQVVRVRGSLSLSLSPLFPSLSWISYFSRAFMRERISSSFVPLWERIAIKVFKPGRRGVNFEKLGVS